VERVPIRLHEVVAESVEELRLLYPTSTLLHLRDGEAPSSGDPRRLAQVVGNLVSNAITYGAAGAPITVTTRTRDISSITVHNEGPAIAAEIQAQMFEPMTRGQDGGAPRSVGLGLFIVREIARAHGGSAFVSSTVSGTSFRVEWPAGS
jgi:phosphoserine phosphatase RsbU/P